MPAIARHTACLAQYTRSKMLELKHGNGLKVCFLYGRTVEKTGCFCNPGACAKFLGLSHSDLLSNLEAGHVCWDDNDVLHGKPTGAVRISFGYMSTFEDAEKFLTFLKTSFVTKTSSLMNLHSTEAEEDKFSDVGWQQLEDGVRLKSITIYPIKSCAGFTVSRWPLVDSGLKYDREWLVRGPNGEILTQKKGS
ncbi:hypothetical protein HPP92_015697 [Vanilla planifolia]|uniref:Molybdenum cofactor sulfurase middle domain-containing protein n=1 Tax=Vanilla planifolia TaxID=51239 RepID=A0A835QHT2_VANPL|nr:hypothetical protein HPP92_015697 [Vanilla planifolia]